VTSEVTLDVKILKAKFSKTEQDTGLVSIDEVNRRLDVITDKRLVASDSFSTLALYKFIYLLL